MKLQNLLEEFDKEFKKAKIKCVPHESGYGTRVFTDRKRYYFDDTKKIKAFMLKAYKAGQEDGKNRLINH